jgi:hypothetical protein
MWITTTGRLLSLQMTEKGVIPPHQLHDVITTLQTSTKPQMSDSQEEE